MTLIHIDIDVLDETEATRILSVLKREQIPHRVQGKPVLTAEQRAAARERIMRGGSQTLDVEAMIAYNKEERPMPFRENE
jgi:hypothetical protein